MMLHRPLWVAIVLLVPAFACADDVTDADMAAAKEAKAKVLSAMKKEIADLDRVRLSSAKNGDPQGAKVLAQQIKEKRTELGNATRKSLEEYAAEVSRQRQEQEAQSMRAAEEQERQAAAEQAKAKAENEPERRRLSGNCPLKLGMINYFHVSAEATRLGVAAKEFPQGLFGPQTIVVVEVENKFEQPVEAYEVLVEFLDGFDEVIQQQRFQGPRLQPGESRKSVNGVQRVDTALQMRVYLEKAKLEDGTIWKRLPEHKMIGKLNKQMDGAKKVGG